MPNALLTNITVISKTSAEWVSLNPILPSSQAAYSTDTKELRIGNGILPWASLPVDIDHGSVPSHNTIHRHDGRDPITPADIQAAPVDTNNKVPVANLPIATSGTQGITQLNNTLTSTDATRALTAAQGKVLKDLVDTKESSSNKNIANGYAGLDANGKVLESLLPSIALMDTFEAASETAMLLLNTARKGDICIRTDLNRTFILAGDGYATLSNWKELKTPTDLVLSVAGKTGTVTLVKSDVGLGNVDNTSDTNKPISTATQTALNLKADKSITVNGQSLSSNVVLSTGDITEDTDKRYVTDSHLTILGNTAGVNTGNETATSVGNLISTATGKTTPADADSIGISDSAASGILKKLTFANLKAAFKTYFDTLYNLYTHPATHPASMITEDSSRRFTSDSEQSNWNDAYTHSTSPHAPVSPNFTETVTITNAVPQINMVDTDQGMTRYIHFNGGIIGFLTSAGGWAFRVDDAGNAIATGDITAFSDIRLKKDLEQIQDALSKVEQLTGYTFTRIDTKQKHAGLIAQDVKKVLPEAITNMDEYMTLSYGSITGLLVEAIKDLSKRVKDLESKIN